MHACTVYVIHFKRFPQCHTVKALLSCFTLILDDAICNENPISIYIVREL